MEGGGDQQIGCITILALFRVCHFHDVSCRAGAIISFWFLKIQRSLSKKYSYNFKLILSYSYEFWRLVIFLIGCELLKTNRDSPSPSI